jgi:dihydrofolate reductase
VRHAADVFQTGGTTMRTLAINTFLSLDGVMQAPGGPEEDPTGGFTHGGWSVHHWDDAMNERMAASMAQPFALLLGRKTYEIFAAHWPHVGEGVRDERGGTASDIDDPAAAAINGATKYVASTTLTSVDWQNSVLLGPDVVGAVKELKSGDGPEIQVHGSWDLIQTLLRHDLIDEFRLWTFPVLLGSGKKLFADGTVPAGLRLVDSQTSPSGVVMAVYRRAGEVEHGSFAFEVPTAEEEARRANLD